MEGAMRWDTDAYFTAAVTAFVVFALFLSTMYAAIGPAAIPGMPI